MLCYDCISIIGSGYDLLKLELEQWSELHSFMFHAALWVGVDHEERNGYRPMFIHSMYHGFNSCSTLVSTSAADKLSNSTCFSTPRSSMRR